MECEQALSLLIETQGLKLPNEYECYITFDAKSEKYKYYYVDHTTQTVFWLEDIDPERHNITMGPVCSVAQMSTSDICSSPPIPPRTLRYPFGIILTAGAPIVVYPSSSLSGYP